MNKGDYQIAKNLDQAIKDEYVVISEFVEKKTGRHRLSKYLYAGYE